MSAQLHQQLTKIGPARKVAHQRVWIEGRHLAAAGFIPGDRYHRTETATGLLLTRTADGSGAFTVSGKGDKPIIDISGAVIPRLFPLPATHVAVVFTRGHITLSLPSKA